MPEYAYDNVANKSTPSLDQQALGFQVELAAKLLFDYSVDFIKVPVPL